jgi:hypothetical protein
LNFFANEQEEEDGANGTAGDEEKRQEEEEDAGDVLPLHERRSIGQVIRMRRASSRAAKLHKTAILQDPEKTT